MWPTTRLKTRGQVDPNGGWYIHSSATSSPGKCAARKELLASLDMSLDKSNEPPTSIQPFDLVKMLQDATLWAKFLLCRTTMRIRTPPPLWSRLVRALVGPTALLVLLAAATGAGRIRLGLLSPCMCGRRLVCLARDVADDLEDSPQFLGCFGVSLGRCQRIEPPGLLVILGDASASLVKRLRTCGTNL